MKLLFQASAILGLAAFDNGGVGSVDALRGNNNGGVFRALTNTTRALTGGRDRSIGLDGPKSEVITIFNSDPDSCPIFDSDEEGCEVPEGCQCGGLDHEGCTECEPNTICAMVNEDLSVCLPSTKEKPQKRCVVDDYQQCGGQMWTGCQRCKPESRCVAQPPTGHRYVCEPKKSRRGKGAGLPDGRVRSLGNLAKGIDSQFDQDNEDENVSEGQLRREMAKVFASEQGRVRIRELRDSNDPDFEEQNAEIEADYRHDWCEMAQKENSKLSAETRDCLCEVDSDEPAMYCMAKAAAEMEDYLERKAAERGEAEDERRRMIEVEEDPNGVTTVDHNGNELDFMRRDLGLKVECELSIGSDDDAAIYDYLEQLIDLIKDGEACLGAECTVPIPKLPMEAYFGIEACLDSFPRTVDPEYDSDEHDCSAQTYNRRQYAIGMYVHIYAGLCLKGGDDLQDILDLVGMDLCFLEAGVYVYPMLGLLDFYVSTGWWKFYALASVDVVYNDYWRDRFGMCHGCWEDYYDDCEMCKGGYQLTSEAGFDAWWFSKSVEFGPYTKSSC